MHACIKEALFWRGKICQYPKDLNIETDGSGQTVATRRSLIRAYCKTCIFGGYSVLATLAINGKSAEI